jgi:hypothetical protein
MSCSPVIYLLAQAPTMPLDLSNLIGDFRDWLFRDAAGLASLIAIPLALLVLLETIKLRHIETDPEITVFLDRNARAFGTSIELVVKNVGRGQAYELRFTVDPDPEIWPDWKISSMTMISEGLSHMAPGHELRLDLGTYQQVNKGPITISVAYKSKKPRLVRMSSFSDSYTIDVRQFEQSFDTAGEDPQVELIAAVRHITTAIGGVSRSTSSISKELARLNESNNNQAVTDALPRPVVNKRRT